MKKKTINFVENEVEEAAVSFLAEKTYENEDEDDYHLIFEDADIFLEKLKTLSYNKRKGWEGREKAFAEISKRILNNEIVVSKYYSKYHYSLAQSRFNSIAERSFDRIIDEQFHAKIFFRFINEWKHGILKKDFKIRESEIEQILRRPEFRPNDSWTDYRPEVGAQAEIKLLYKDMTKVRFRNLIQKVWENVYSPEMKSLRDHYPEKFSKLLPLKQFLDYYGPDDNHDRCCGYCNISEHEVNALDAQGEIKTKRIYHRGRTMEVDKKDPQKDYSDLGNLILSCYWCNNAKTDEFSKEEFASVAMAIAQVWRTRMQGFIKKAG